MPDDISIQVSGTIGTLSGSIGLKIDPFKAVGNQTPPADPIAGCDSPYKAPTTTVPTAVWWWDIDPGIPAGEIPPYEFQWGTFDTTQPEPNKTARKLAIFTDLTKNNSADLEKQVSQRVTAIEQLNNSYFSKNPSNNNQYFDLSYVYSDDMSLVYSVKELGHGMDEISGQSVVYFPDENSAKFVVGTIQPDGKTLKTTGGQSIVLPNVTDQVHLEASFKLIGSYLQQLQGIGVGADFLFSTTLSGTDGPKGDSSLPWTKNAMLKSARYNAYAGQNGLPKYNHFNIDTEPGNKPDLQKEYIDVNHAINALFGPKSPSGFDFPIAGYVNQQQMQGNDPFAGQVALTAPSMIFGSYRGTTTAQCAQYDTLKNPAKMGKGTESVWTVAYEGSNNPVGASPTSPLINVENVANTREIADIAIAQFLHHPFPYTVNEDPMVALSSFLPIWAQIVHGQDGLG